ncbi:hypothetical protein Pse7367_1298 [Thalassoporum mexicanum PCC 7367]|uniref:hypothetical protein n=1 Tax=Thalassoporum mexicanum TaxID=3457544 RepID=UPI00029FF198|nr:hypothetical protein [Pseudanabaena sp. PCC 7367]AFY69592.1 hypothetical protein Pse7367_1298 [Pseudanabaena sp. PCC 7367]
MFVETVNAVSTGLGLVQISRETFPTFKRIYNRLTNGNLRIAVFGASGTGKTTLGKILTGDLDNLSQPYQESIRIEEYKLSNNLAGKVIIAPGQERRENSWNDLFRLISGGQIRLIINVVSWGYHSFGEAGVGFSYKYHELYQPGMDVGDFVKVYAQNRRDREINVLKKLLQYLEIADSKETILITLVTKQDLWWHDRQLVKQHYMQEDYNKILEEATNKIGSNNFKHEFLSASLVIANYISAAGELMIPNAEGYDSSLRDANLRNFFDTVESLIGTSLT